MTIPARRNGDTAVTVLRTPFQDRSCPRGGLSTSHEQDNQDYQENGAKSATDIWSSVVETAAAKQDQQNNDQDYQVHDAPPSETIAPKRLS